MMMPLTVAAPHVAGALDLIVTQLGDYLAEFGEDPQGLGSTTLSSIYSIALLAEISLRESIECQRELDADRRADEAAELAP